MRVKIICGVVALLFVMAWVSRAGTGTDAVRRSQCAAIGYELRARAAGKAAEMAATRARGGLTVHSAQSLKQWQVYIDHLDAMGKVLIDNFSDPWPPHAGDRSIVQAMDLNDLTHRGEACTG